ncbi:hypothetical protein HanRHA438_Chr08g0359771 [Helianthus annuus]|nr:hypothetical protein HanHA89_Chr08g0305171 [Helianthus annuus]KAJ0898700.1 hypothetical protein HanRHA438_Chr08g0359771 [Helianthus annuus]KAJ0902337.1 hypothetical protein HanPSC8_Chr08g0335791 [Helianthus annuus]
MISQAMWFVCSLICCIAKIVLDVYVCLSIVLFVWLELLSDIKVYTSRISVLYESCDSWLL